MSTLVHVLALGDPTDAALRELSSVVAARRKLPPPAVRRLLRETAGVSLAQVARAVGVSKQCVSQWELGSRRPSGERLERYIAVLDTLRGGPG